MCEEVWDLIKLYTSPDDYSALVCVSRRFRDTFTTIKGPVMLRNLLILDVGFPRNMKISSASELTWVRRSVSVTVEDLYLTKRRRSSTLSLVTDARST